MSKEAEDGVLTAIYINKMRALGFEREYAFMHLVGALSITAGPKLFAEALQNAYISLERQDPAKVDRMSPVSGSTADALFTTGFQQGVFLERERIIKLLAERVRVLRESNKYSEADEFFFTIAALKGEQK